MENEYQQNTGEEVEAAAPSEAYETETHSADESSSRQVPLDALQAQRSESQRLKDELKMYKDYFALMQSQGGQQPTQQQKEDIGLSKDDVITYGDLEKLLDKKERQYQMSLQELKMSQKYPDYQDVVTKYLPEVLNNNPGLVNSLQQTQDYELAYYLAKNSESYKQDHKRSKKNADAERIVQNANRAGSLSSVGKTSPINEAKRYKEMSEKEFKELVNRNMGHF